jgi:hypothetical protein
LCFFLFTLRAAADALRLFLFRKDAFDLGVLLVVASSESRLVRDSFINVGNHPGVTRGQQLIQRRRVGAIGWNQRRL